MTNIFQSHLKNNLKINLFFKILKQNFLTISGIYIFLITVFLILLVLSLFTLCSNLLSLLCGAILSIFINLLATETINQYRNEIKYSGLMNNIASFYSKETLIKRLKNLFTLFFKDNLDTISNLNDLTNFIKENAEQIITPDIEALRKAINLFFIRDYKYNFCSFPNDLSIKFSEENILNLYAECDKLLNIANTNSQNKQNDIKNCLSKIIQASIKIIEFLEIDTGYMTTLLKLSIQIFKEEKL